ncbi:MAG: hypothetical protein J3R72DRAFT_51840 [Linnemannia gamsii]|nr:MAG: hypothetical protein J3R72DRAFT_51840 [Linnemannia gamsii]
MKSCNIYKNEYKTMGIDASIVFFYLQPLGVIIVDVKKKKVLQVSYLRVHTRITPARKLRWCVFKRFVRFFVLSKQHDTLDQQWDCFNTKRTPFNRFECNYSFVLCSPFHICSLLLSTIHNKQAGNNQESKQGTGVTTEKTHNHTNTFHIKK